MLKQVSVMKRHPDLTMDEFIRRYEGEHAKFGEALFRKAKRYVRRYVQPEKNFLTGEVAELDSMSSWKSGGSRAKISWKP
jgi:EthD domain